MRNILPIFGLLLTAGAAAAQSPSALGELKSAAGPQAAALQIARPAASPASLPVKPRLACTQDSRAGDGPLVQIKLLKHGDGTFDAVYERSVAHGLGGSTPAKTLAVHGLRCSFSASDAWLADCKNADGETFAAQITPAAPTVGYPEESVQITVKAKDPATGALQNHLLMFSSHPAEECPIP